MNHSYRLVWSNAAERYVPAPETARGRGTGRPGKALAPVLLGALLALPAFAQAPPAAALPTGGQVVNGQASIGVNGNQMTIGQTSQKAILHWQGFDIGSAAKVQFNQPGASAVALNRVVAGSASQIHGQLGANGQVWLVNPNGVVFGQGSQVNVGGLVASTMNITDADFLAGRQVFTRGAAQGGITNQGDITVAEGGTLALLAANVNNEGTLTARLGNVVLAGGDRVTLQAGAGGRLQVAVEPATVRTLIENRQLIVADGGQVVMTARAADALSASVVSNTGTVQARTLAEKDGRILLLADMRQGEVNAAGTLQAAFVETSAASVVIDPQLKVNTDGGHWLIDPVDITIDQNKATAIQTALQGGDVTITTADGGDNSSWQGGINGIGAGQGDIHVNAPITYENHLLTLNADHSIHVNATIAVNGQGTLALNYGGTQGNAGANPAAGSNLIANGPVDFAQEGSSLLRVNGHDYRVINSLGALQNMRGNLAGNYALGGSMDASTTAGWNNGDGFEPIGSGGHPFHGTFDGLGHAIDGLTIDRPDQDGVGLFGHTLNATLRNVMLLGASMDGRNSVGALVGHHQASNGGTASISHAGASAQVSGTTYVGGLVGNNDAEGGAARITHAHAQGQVRGSDEVGGLVGRSRATFGGTTLIYSSQASARVGGTNYIGGLVGSNEADNGTASVLHVTATGRVRGELHVGGLVGANMDEGGTASIAQAMATGRVDGVAQVGGLVGRNDAASGVASVMDSHATGRVSGTSEVGGLIGYNYGSDEGHAHIVRVRATGQVTGLEHVGGMVGSNHADIGAAWIVNAHALGETSGRESVGGLVGSNRASDGGAAHIERSTATGEIRGTVQTGGLAGSNHADIGTASIYHSHASGPVSSMQEVGGLVGGNHASGDGTSHIGHSFASGAVDGAEQVGGLVGRNRADDATASISMSHASGNVSGLQSVGGLVGLHRTRHGGAVRVEHSAATGNVMGPRRIDVRVLLRMDGAAAVIPQALAPEAEHQPNPIGGPAGPRQGAAHARQSSQAMAD